jgi:predicted glycosyltransferase
MTRRVLFHVQHLLGIGHLRRAEILAQAMASVGLQVVVAYGGKRLAEAPFRGVQVAELPAASIANENFSALLDADGRHVDTAWKDARRDKLLALYRELDPDVVLIELFPFGRRQFAFELLPLLEAIHAQKGRARVACSVRDVLVAKPARDAEIVERLRRYFDAVLVHGDPAVIPFATTFGGAAEVADLIRYTGYVVATRDAAPAIHGEKEVLVSAGGGAVGAPLLFAAAAARDATTLAKNVWRFLTGPNLPEPDFRRLATCADDRTIIERFRPDFAARLKVAALSISQAGYNTTMDILASDVRAVVIPYEAKGETEQRLRAEVLASKRLLTLIPERELSPARLTAGVAEALGGSAACLSVDLTGAATTARMVHELATLRVR